MDDLEGRLATLIERLTDGEPADRSELEHRVHHEQRRRHTQRISVIAMTAALVIAVVVFAANRSDTRRQVPAGPPTSVTTPPPTPVVHIAVAERPGEPTPVLDIAWNEQPGALIYMPGNQSGNTAPNAFAVDEARDRLFVLDTGSGRVVSYQLHDGAFVSDVSLETNTAGDLVYDPVTQLGYVFDSEKGDIITVDTSSPQLTALGKLEVRSDHVPAATLVVDRPRDVIWLDAGGQLFPIIEPATEPHTMPTLSHAIQAPAIGVHNGVVTIIRPDDPTVELSFASPAILALAPIFDTDGTYWLYVKVGTFESNRPLIVHVDLRTGTAVGLAGAGAVVNDDFAHTYATATRVYVMASDEQRFRIDRFNASADTSVH